MSLKLRSCIFPLGARAKKIDFCSHDQFPGKTAWWCSYALYHFSPRQDYSISISWALDDIDRMFPYKRTEAILRWPCPPLTPLNIFAMYLVKADRSYITFISSWLLKYQRALTRLLFTRSEMTFKQHNSRPRLLNGVFRDDEFRLTWATGTWTNIQTTGYEWSNLNYQVRWAYVKLYRRCQLHV